ncbi:MAG: DUF1499 domain-containing protein [Betaproteobacteria bacterium]|nr:DUF1499 domain-containing protein [Betaproteobacteria bacterium]
MGIFSGQRPGNLGAREGRLAACPDKPNCVSSHAEPMDAGHYIAPLAISGGAVFAWQALLAVVRECERCAIIDEKPGYLHAEFTSGLMGYVDDAEFLLDEKASSIEVRSASRLGSSDFGVNRKRVEAIRAAWVARLARSNPAKGG